MLAFNCGKKFFHARDSRGTGHACSISQEDENFRPYIIFPSFYLPLSLLPLPLPLPLPCRLAGKQVAVKIIKNVPKYRWVNEIHLGGGKGGQWSLLEGASSLPNYFQLSYWWLSISGFISIQCLWCIQQVCSIRSSSPTHRWKLTALFPLLLSEWCELSRNQSYIVTPHTCVSSLEVCVYSSEALMAVFKGSHYDQGTMADHWPICVNNVWIWLGIQEISMNSR